MLKLVFFLRWYEINMHVAPDTNLKGFYDIIQKQNNKI